MASATEEFDAKGERLTVALVLDRPVNAANEQKLGHLVARLRNAEIAHLSLVCDGVTRPESWQAGFKVVSRIEIAPDAFAQHFIAGGFTLTVLPEGSGRGVVAAAARLQASQGAAPVTIEGFDAKIEAIAGPSPDLIIVTGGTPNLRGSLTWQAAYGEFVFLERSWTELVGDDLDQALKEFAMRGRRFGGIAKS